MRLWIKGARQVVRVVDNGERVLRGEQQKNANLAILEEKEGIGYSIVIDDNGLIAAIGDEQEIAEQYSGIHFDEVIDAHGLIVMPGFVDAHTHPVWAGDRVHEFAMKIAGATYMQIYEAGGGIHFTVEHTRKASEDELYQLLKERLQRMMKNGTLLVEAKSGYGLDTENEMKMLKVLERAKKELPIEISSTFCGAHAVPKGKTALQQMEYILLEQFPALKKLMDSGELSVDSVDVFCEKGVFDVPQTRAILEAGRRANLRLNFHADELNPIGGAEMGALLKAEAMSHLEEITEAGIKAMAESESVAVILPTTAYFLRLKPPPVRSMIQAGVTVALGSDFNPNAYCMSMPMVMNLACVLCHMTLPEALVAATLNSAAALGKSETHGSLERAKVADMILIDAPSWEHIVYQFGEIGSILKYVVKGGKVVHRISNL